MPYREFLVERVAGGRRGSSADYVAYFFLRARAQLRFDGGFGLVATNTIAQGDTREVGLDQITSDCQIIRAIQSKPWPGEASLEIAYVWVRKGSWAGPFLLDGQAVSSITTLLTQPGKAVGSPYRLKANEGKSFQGSIVLGMGFVLEPEEARELIAKDPRNRDVLFPYLNGEDLNGRPDQSASRWVINFHDWPMERAEQYPDCMRIVREKVMPERTRRKQNGEYQLRYPLYERWWQYADKRPALYAAIAGLERVLVLCIVTHHVAFAFVPANLVYAHRLVVFPLTRAAEFAVLQSNLHEPWARDYSSQLETRINYSPSDCFLTFPFPDNVDRLHELGTNYESTRSRLMSKLNMGLTRLYNSFHTNAPETDELRALQVALDRGVAAAYSWSFDLGHGFHDTKQGVRFTISPQARARVLDLLLALNHERKAAEERDAEVVPRRKAAKKRSTQGTQVQLLERI